MIYHFFHSIIKCNQLSQTTNRSMLIGGVVCCCLVQPNSTSETSSHALIRGRSSTWSHWRPDKWFWQLCWSWGQNIWEHARVLALSQHGGLQLNVCYAKIVALQHANYQRLCLNGCFMRRSSFNVCFLRSSWRCTFDLLESVLLLSRSTQFSCNYSVLPHGSG